jgi:hypothetical protein
MHIISFGQSGYYEKIAIDLLRKLKKAYPKAKFTVYNESSLSEEINHYASQYKRGYGYWRWKPYIILEHLDKIEEDEILLYVDGRSHFNSSKILWLDKFSNDNNYDICVWKMNFTEEKYTFKQIFEIFGLNQNSQEAKSGQIAAGVIALKKRNSTTSLIDRWKYLLDNYPEFFRDDLNQVDQINDFIENRHDQSAFSLLVKTSKCETLYLDDSDFNKKESIFIQFKFHEGNYSTFKNRIRVIFGIGIGYKLFTNIVKYRNKIKNLFKN